MDQLFSEFGAGFDSQASGFSWPAATLSDAGRELTLQLQIPGVLEKDIEITSTENSVTISGERKDEVPEGYSVRRKERGALKFARTVSLPCKIQAEGIEAQLKNGVLSVSLPKAPEAQPRRISVRSA
jgi:HSP20 family protein